MSLIVNIILILIAMGDANEAKFLIVLGGRSDAEGGISSTVSSIYRFARICKSIKLPR